MIENLCMIFFGEIFTNWFCIWRYKSLEDLEAPSVKQPNVPAEAPAEKKEMIGISNDLTLIAWLIWKLIVFLAEMLENLKIELLELLVM